MHNPRHGRYFLNREPPYWLQSSITGSAFRGFILILLKCTKVFRSRMAAFRCIDTRRPRLARVVEFGEGRVICLLRSDWVSHRSSGSIGWKIERVVNPRHPIFIGPVHSSNMLHCTIGPCTGQSQGSARANRVVYRHLKTYHLNKTWPRVTIAQLGFAYVRRSK